MKDNATELLKNFFPRDKRHEKTNVRRRIWASNVDSLQKEAWEGIFWRDAKVKTSWYIGDGTHLNKKLWAKRKHVKASEKESSPNKSDPFAYLLEFKLVVIYRGRFHTQEKVF